MVTRVETERQRQRLIEDSVFGFWTDSRNSLRIRITPFNSKIRIRIAEVIDPAVIDAIGFFCNLRTKPKRANWAYFDLVTGLIKHPEDNSYILGSVHLPNADHRTSASLLMLPQRQAQLCFFPHNAPELCIGSITFRKSSD